MVSSRYQPPVLHRHSALFKADAVPVGAGAPANTGAAGAMHRVGFFAAKAAPTGYADCLQFQLSTRQRSPKSWAISHKSGASGPYA